MSKKVSLQELMGREGSKGITLKDLSNILGDSMPDLPKNQVGRFRLVRALQQRFGSGFRNLPGVSDVVKEFDSDIEFEKTIMKLKKLKPKGTK